MRTLRLLILPLFVFWCAQVWAQAGPAGGEARGALLYRTYCSTCHSSQIHWREQKRVRDWGSLLEQIRRWQVSIGLGWSEAEITDVALYLNAAYYGFAVVGNKSAPEAQRQPAGLPQALQ